MHVWCPIDQGKPVFDAGFFGSATREFWSRDFLERCTVYDADYSGNNVLDRSGTEVAPQFASHGVATCCSLGREPKVQIA